MTDSGRRGVLGALGCGVLGAAVGLAAGVKLAGSRRLSDLALMASPSPRVEGIIDTHHHMLPPFFVQAVGADKIAAVMPNGQVPVWSPELDLQVMDEYKIRKAVLSVSPGLWTDTPAQAIPLARQVNAFGARLAADHPHRYGLFAVMPLPDIDASLKEAAYALDTLKADGLIMFTNYEGAYLGDARFAPLYEELNRRRAVVFVHPTKTGFSVKGIPDAVLEFPFDTTRTIASLIYAGFTLRYPDIRFIFSHAGGAAPYLANRMEGPTRGNPALAKLLPNGAVAELKKLYWDTALSFTATSLNSLLTLTDPSKVMFGSDFPFAPKIAIPLSLKSLNALLPAADLASVLHGSALRLMPGLAT